MQKHNAKLTPLIDPLIALIGADIIQGNSGNDVLLGGTGNDTIYGDVLENSFAPAIPGGDYVWAGAGNDVIFGEGGNDHMRWRTRAATINGRTAANDEATNAWRIAA